MKKKNGFLSLCIMILIIGSVTTIMGNFNEDEIPQNVVEATLTADQDPIYLNQETIITLTLTNYHNKSIETIVFHQSVPEGVGFIDALGGANYTTRTIDYTWRDPETNQTSILGVNNTLTYWYIISGTDEGTFNLKGIVYYRFINDSETQSDETNLLRINVHKNVPGNLQAFQVITSGLETIILGDNVTIELVLRNFHENHTLYNVSFYQELPNSGLELTNVSVADAIQIKVNTGNFTEQFINYTWSAPLEYNESLILQYTLNGNLNGSYTVTNGEIAYDILIENETRIIEVNSLSFEIGFSEYVLPLPPKGTRDIGVILLIGVIIVPIIFFAMAAIVTKAKRLR